MLMFLGIYLAIGMLLSLFLLYAIGSVYGTFIKFIESAGLTPHETEICYNYPKYIEFIFYLITTLGYPYFIYKLIWGK